MSYNSPEILKKETSELLSYLRKKSIARSNDISFDQVEIYLGTEDNSVFKGIFLKSALKNAKKMFQQECDAKYRQIFTRSNK